MPTSHPVASRSLPIAVARSWLLVNAADPAAVARGRACAADVVALDLEDGVVDADKPAARAAVRELLAGGTRLWVRIGNAETADWVRDLAALDPAAPPAGVLLAKAEHPEQVRATAAALVREIPIVAMIESATGLENVAAIAAAGPVVRLAFGSGDFRLDTGIGDDPSALAYTRSRLVVASRAARIGAPVDGPTPGAEAAALAEALAVGGAAGMRGKLCLAPAQAAVINRHFTPTAEAVRSARSVIERLGSDGAAIRTGSERPQLARALGVQELAATFAACDSSSAPEH